MEGPDSGMAIRSSRVLLIGLDVGDGKLVRQWIAEGHLPILASLLARGTWSWLSTPAEVLHVSAWPSLYTGTMPGQHGVYYPFQPSPGRQGASRIGSQHYGQPPFWKLLDAAGRRCIIFDAPYTFPAEGFRGVQIFEWGTWAWYWKQMSSPPSLLGDIRKHFGSYPVGFDANQIGFATLDLSDLRARLLKGASVKAKAARWLMSAFPWDLFLVVFGETHPAAHYFWPPNGSSPASGASYLRDIYVAIDRAIGEILDGVDDDVTLFIVSGDGAGPNYAGWHLLPDLLTELNLLGVNGNAKDEGSAGKRDLLKSIRDCVPLSVRQTLSRRLPAPWRDSLMSRWGTSNIDWSRTRAFCLPTDLEGCIRINLKGREPEGIVDQGAAYEDICDELVARLQSLTNPQTDRLAVRRIVRTDEVFPGHRRHYLPDIVVSWSDEAKIEELRSPEIPVVRGASPDCRTGTHRPQGFMLAYGPDVPQGKALEGADVIDLAPTILAKFGMHQSEHMQGQVQRGLC